MPPRVIQRVFVSEPCYNLTAPPGIEETNMTANLIVHADIVP